MKTERTYTVAEVVAMQGLVSGLSTRKYAAQKTYPDWENRLFEQIKQSGLPEPKRQWKIPEDNRFIFDFAYPDIKLVIEVDGGIWMKKGAHNTGNAIIRDCKKNNRAVLSGYALLRFTTDRIESGEALNEIEMALKERMT